MREPFRRRHAIPSGHDEAQRAAVHEGQRLAVHLVGHQRLAEREYWQRTGGAQLPMWLMTSHTTDGPIREALGGQIDGERVDAFLQGALAAASTPDGCLFRGDDGLPSIHATGHGDLPEALAAAGLLDRFLAAGGRYLWIMNLDNLGAAVDPLVLGWHIDHGAPLTVEVVDKQEGDRGGILRGRDARAAVLRNFRRPTASTRQGCTNFRPAQLLSGAPRCAAMLDGLVTVPVRRKRRRRDRQAWRSARLTLGAPEPLSASAPGAESGFLPQSWEKLDALTAQMATHRRFA
jgi:UTP--glucose-1-phosphate uridylyltransferase